MVNITRLHNCMIVAIDVNLLKSTNMTKKIEDLFELIETQVSLGEDRDWTEDQLLLAINDLKEIVRSALKQPDLMEIYYDSDFPNQLEKSYRQSLNI